MYPHVNRMAPEYLMGMSKYTTSCDIYSVGIIIWEIYARKSPFEGEDYKDVIRGVCNRRVNKRPVIPAVTPPKFVDMVRAGPLFAEAYGIQRLLWRHMLTTLFFLFLHLQFQQ